VIERAVILCLGGVIGPDLISLRHALDLPSATHDAAAVISVDQGQRPGAKVIRFCDAERHAILRALELSGWRISARGGAADILGQKPPTWHAKMKKLGIRRPSGFPMDEKYSRA
jgi:transcriptional regulator with GAF, ATPase, and Fis domain